MIIEFDLDVRNHVAHAQNYLIILQFDKFRFHKMKCPCNIYRAIKFVEQIS
jgi:hypothetical protein